MSKFQYTIGYYHTMYLVSPCRNLVKDRSGCGGCIYFALGKEIQPRLHAMITICVHPDNRYHLLPWKNALDMAIEDGCILYPYKYQDGRVIPIKLAASFIHAVNQETQMSYAAELDGNFD